jgi:hypothetical protein
VQKIVNPDPNGIASTLSFPMTVRCSNPNGNYSLTVQGNSSVVPGFGVPIGSTCAVAEVSLPALPAGCHWASPQYVPQPVTIARGMNHETVTNGYECAPPTGSLIVQKIVNPDPMGVAGTLSFPMTVTCANPNGNYTVTVRGDSSAPPISNLPAGSTCTVAEASLPALPPGCTWMSPQFAPQNVTIGPGRNPETVTNGYRCVPTTGTLTVQKIVNPDPRGIGSTMPFPMTVTCTDPNGVYPLTVQGNSSAAPINNVLIGSTCTVSEAPLPVLPPGCTWLSPQYGPLSLTIAIGINHETVINGYECIPTTGSLTVQKLVNPDPHGIAGAVPFQITVTCTNPNGNFSLAVLGDSSAAPINNLEIGSHCSIAENLPPAPPGCIWLPPQYTPQPVTIGPGMNHETVTNGYQCQQALLTVQKTVNPDPRGIGGVLIFPMTVTCFNPNGTYSLTVQGENSAGPINNLTVGSTCTVSEQPPLPTLPPGCTWMSLQYTPPVVMIAPGPNHETVTNGYQCQQASLTVQKIVNSDPRGIAGTLSFPMTVACSNPNGNYSLTVQGNSSAAPINNLPVGSTCTLSEAPLPALPNTCAWQSPQYSPQTVIIGAGTNNETVTNSYRCALKTNQAGQCSSPMIANADGTCACPPGTVLRGEECVQTIDCRAPLIPNAAGTECVCRSGLVLRSGKCVESIVCNKPATLNSAGTACVCPDGMVKKGNTCVESEHNPRNDIPLGVPGRGVPLGIPGLGGPGGGTGGPRGGGGQGEGPRGGGEGGGTTPGRR